MASAELDLAQLAFTLLHTCGRFELGERDASRSLKPIDLFKIHEALEGVQDSELQQFIYTLLPPR